MGKTKFTDTDFFYLKMEINDIIKINDIINVIIIIIIIIIII